MLSAAQYNLSNSGNNLSVNCLGRLFQRLISITPESSLKFLCSESLGLFSTKGKVKVLSFSLVRGICFPAYLLPLIFEDNINSRGGNEFSLHFTCRARGWRCIPFWVTHTSIELSTEGQIPRINSSLTWSYTKQLSTFSLWQQSSTGPAWSERLYNLCTWRFFRIHPNKVLYNPFWSQSPCWKQKVELETSWSFCFPMNLLPWASSFDLFKLTPIMKLKKGGKVASDNCPWNQFRVQNLRDGRMILVHLLLLLLTPSLAGRQESHTITPLLRVVVG